MKRIYILKNLRPWMVNELMAFSYFTGFKLVILRKPSEPFTEQLHDLQKNGVEIHIRPFLVFPSLKRICFSVWFIFKYLPCFIGLKNLIFGIKSVYWFIRLKEDTIPNNCLIHAQFATQAGIIAMMYKHFFTNCDYHFTFHAHDIYYKNRWFSRLLNNSSCAFSISEYNIQYVIEKYGSKPEKISLSRLGVFQPEPFEIPKQKRKPFTIGFLSWWDKKKGLILLLQSFKQLVTEHNLPVYLLLAGDGPMRSQTLNYIKKNNLHEHVKVMGWIFGAEKEQFFKSIDLFVLPSVAVKNDMDGIPVVLMEAIWYGIPVVSTSISGIPELCKNKYNGFLIPSGNIEALTRAMLDFYTMDNSMFSVFRHNAMKTSKKFDIIYNSQKKLEAMEWI
ncbi:MAG: glycosyltransferase family 4 protein [Bacteroidales bacterium]